MDYILYAVIVLGAASLGAPAFQLWGGRNRNSAYVVVAALAAALGLIVLNTASPQKSTAFGSLLYSDSLGGIFAIVTLFVSLLVAVVSVVSTEGKENAPLYYSLLSFSALGMMLLAYSADLLMIFVAWELMSIPTYALAGFDKKRAQSNEASAKYAILGALSSAIILYAISLTYGVAGTTQIAAAVKAISSQPFNPVATVAVLLFVVGFGFKMSIVPFHMWVPDAYEGAPTTIATLFAAATKKAGFIAAIRVLLAVTTIYVITQNPLFSTANVFAALAVVTMTLGNVAALTQKSMTRLLAYSSIAQAGYILIGFVIFSYGQTAPGFNQNAILGMTGSLFHIINHAVMKGAAFFVAGLVILLLRRGDLQAYSGLAKRMPISAFTLTIAFLSLAGVPPLAGFWSKLFLFMSVLNSPYAWLAVAAVLNSAFSMGYYAWIIKRMYMDDPDSNERVVEPMPYVMVFAVLVALMIGIGIFPGAVISFVQNAIPAIFPH